MEAHTTQAVTLHDKTFVPYLSEQEIREAVLKVAKGLNEDYQGKNPIIVAVLNGVFMFASDLMKELCLDVEITFVKVASYEGTHTTGTVRELIGLGDNIKDRHLIILEDIVDTGTTLHQVIPGLLNQQPASLQIATLLFKPEAIKYELPLKYIGKEIPQGFIVGYGLDYDGLGRNLRTIYKVAK